MPQYKVLLGLLAPEKHHAYIEQIEAKRNRFVLADGFPSGFHLGRPVDVVEHQTSVFVAKWEQSIKIPQGRLEAVVGIQKGKINTSMLTCPSRQGLVEMACNQRNGYFGRGLLLKNYFGQRGQRGRSFKSKQTGLGWQRISHCQSAQPNTSTQF